MDIYFITMQSGEQFEATEPPVESEYGVRVDTGPDSWLFIPWTFLATIQRIQRRQPRPSSLVDAI